MSINNRINLVARPFVPVLTFFFLNQVLGKGITSKNEFLIGPNCTKMELNYAHISIFL